MRMLPSASSWRVGPVGPKEQKGPGAGRVNVPGVKVWAGVVSKVRAEGSRRRREVRVERRGGIFGRGSILVVVVVEGG